MSSYVIVCINESKRGGQPDLLDFENPIIRENAPSVSLVPVFPVVENKFKIKNIKDLSVNIFTKLENNYWKKRPNLMVLCISSSTAPHSGSSLPISTRTVP